VYPARWHKIYGDKTGESARRILPPLLSLFDVKSTVEIGCGNGHWSEAGIEAGVSDYVLVDGPWNRREDLLVDEGHFRQADLSRPLALSRRFDMAICLEVAEHVPNDSATVLVKSLTDAADIVLFGAAIPYQGGHGHINEQWPSWWRGRFEQFGYRPYDLVRPYHWSDSEIHYYYRQNIFLYVNESNQTASRIAAEQEKESPRICMDAVHPEKFEEIASYESLVLKRLARRFPGWLAMRIRSKLSGAG
jgi:hypothetical protein